MEVYPPLAGFTRRGGHHFTRLSPALLSPVTCSARTAGPTILHPFACPFNPDSGIGEMGLVSTSGGSPNAKAVLRHMAKKLPIDHKTQT